jgi:hypothetical protein
VGSNKEWQIDSFTYNNGITYEVDNNWPTYTATHSEMVSTSPFDYNTPDMFETYNYMELKKKYPALQQAWDHYQMVLKMCRAKEAENEN